MKPVGTKDIITKDHTEKSINGLLLQENILPDFTVMIG